MISCFFTNLFYLGYYLYGAQTMSVEVPRGVMRDLLILNLVLCEMKLTGQELARSNLGKLYLEEKYV